MRRPSSWIALIVLSASCSVPRAAQKIEGGVLLFDFENGDTGWHANVYGEGEMTTGTDANAAVGAAAMAVHCRDLRGANLISPAIPFGEPWRLLKYDRVRFLAQANEPMTKAALVFVTDEAQHPTYSLHFVMDTPGWQQHIYPLSRCWNRGKQALDASRVRQIYITSAGTGAFSIDHIELLEAARTVHLRPDRHAFVRPAAVSPAIDADLNDAAWNSALHLTGFVSYPRGRTLTDQTEAWVTYDAEALYVAARLHSRKPDQLKAVETARDASVWRDDCLEVFIDPGQTHTEWYQFVTNPLGSQYDALLPGGVKGRGIPWNGSWAVKAAVVEDAWLVEMRIPFADFGQVPKPGDSWGFNVCREAPSVGELSMWTDTGGKFTRVRGLADLVFASAADGDVCSLADVSLEEKGAGAYVLRARTTSERALRAAYRVTVQAPDDARSAAEGTVAIRQGEGDLAIPVELDADTEGEAKVWLSLKDADTGDRLAYRAYNFIVSFPSEASLDKLVLVPTPKELTLEDGTFQITPETVTWIGSDPDESRIGAVLYEDVSRCYGVRACVRRYPAAPEQNVILVGRPDTCAELKSELAARGLLERVAALKPEGYALIVTPTRVLIAGRDARGTYYGVRTFLQLMAHATAEGQPPRAPCCRVVDWPDVPFRGVMVYTSGWPQDPHDGDVLKEYIYRQVAGLKYNAIVWQMKAGYQYSRRPRLANRCALTRDTVRDVADFARQHFIEIIPYTNILGHANWIVLKHKELQEDGMQHQICTNHPVTYPMLFDVMEEMLEVFDHPKRLHVGLDEVRWKTFNLPEDKRCPRCRGMPKWKVFADHVIKLHDFLKAKGVEMWMWGDMVVERHNGGPPFSCAKALEVIPNDIVICNWSAEYAKGSSRELSERGFRVAKSNSYQIPVSEEPYVFGNLASFWYRHPWCPMTQGGERGLMIENAYAGQFSWSVNREDVSLSQYRRECDVNVLRLLARPAVPRGGSVYTALDLTEAANRALLDEVAGDGKGWADLGPDLDLSSFPASALSVGRIGFRPVTGSAATPRAVYLTAEGKRSVVVEVRKIVPSLAFLHTTVFPADDEERRTYLKRFLAPNEGAPIATCTVTYAGGATRQFPLRVGMEVGNWLPRRGGEYLVKCPYILRLATGKCRRERAGDADVAVYAFEWPNPETGRRIDSIELTHTGDAAAYALFALSAREPK